MSELAPRAPVLEKYELLEEIGHGGMATVYRARDRRLGREVAVKVIHRHLRENAEVAERFAREARAVAKVRHPGIVEVYDVSGEDEEERYLVVELVRGTTLRKLVGKLDHMPAEIAAAIGIELAEALHHAHEQGVVHRDIKPENVLVEVPGEGDRPSAPQRSARPARSSPTSSADDAGLRVLLTDFGIAKVLDAQGVTSTGQVLGSPAHMAPEQIEGGDVTARADVFALAVLLYECMVGHLPFEGKNPAQVLRRVLDGLYPSAERERPTVGATWSKLLDKALAGDPDERFESAWAFAEAMRDELDALGFDDPHGEVAAFFDDPDGYEKKYEERIVERLVTRADEAREARDVMLATSLYNRALAFRPGDADLLARVSHVARGEQWRRTARRGAVVALISVSLGGVAYGVTRAAQDGAEVDSPEVGARGASARDPEAPGAKPSATNGPAIAPEPAASAGEPGKERATDKERRPAALARVRNPRAGVGTAAPEVKPTGLKRRVGVGAPSFPDAILEIDGVPKQVPGTHELEVGRTYRFEFKAPDGDNCCIASSRQVTVEEGEGPMQVTGHVKFKNAQLAFVGPEGSTAKCPDFFFDKVLQPGQTRSLVMTKIKIQGQCYVKPPDSQGREKLVSLRAGETRTLSVE